MPWFVYLDSGIAVEDNDASTRLEAIERARQTLTEWLQKDNRPHIQLEWNVEHED